MRARSWNTRRDAGPRGNLGRARRCVDRDRAPLAAPRELDDALAQREERVVAADPDPGAGAEPSCRAGAR